MKITTELLKSLNACQAGIDLVATYEDKDHEAVVRRLVADNHWDYANWLLPRLMDYSGYVSYAVYAAELALPIWERQYPNDDRPRKAIEAAKKCIDDPSDINKKAATTWARAAAAATWAAEGAAKEAEWAEAAGIAAAEWAAEGAAKEAVETKIIEKGLEILRKNN